jgi:DNA-binding transcriptional activator of the SARP family
LLGGFRLLKGGEAVALRPGGKVESVLSELALNRERGIGQDGLLEAVWPSADPVLASHSLHSLLYALHRELGDALAGEAPVVRAAGRYRLNAGAGVSVDLDAFEAAASAGDAADRRGDRPAAQAAYDHAAVLYRGDLCSDGDVRHLLYRESLRARQVALLAALADYDFIAGDYPAAAARSLDLLVHDPCREDAHRVVMRCYLHMGKRAQALRQYQLCAAMLRAEFDADPEPATTELYHAVRLNRASV